MTISKNKQTVPENQSSDSAETLNLGYSEEERMQLIRQNYIDIINIVSEAIYVLDESFSFIEINKGAEKMYQFTREELIGQTPESVAAPGLNDMDHIQQIMQTVLETGKENQFDFWAKRKNGEIFPKSVIINKGKFFNINVLIATARDITEQKKVEFALNESENKYKLLLEKSGIGVGLYSLDGKILYFNQKAIEHLGGKVEDYIGKSLLEVFGEEAGNKYIKRLGDIAKNDENIDYEDFAAMQTGDYWFLSNYSKIKDANGETYAIEVLAHDITYRKLEEKLTQQNHREFIDLFDNAPIGYHEIDLEGRIVRMNQTELNLLDYTLDEIKTKFVWELAADNELSKRVTLEKLKKNQISVEPYERVFLRKDGSQVPILVVDKLIFDNHGKLTGIRSSIQDNTERKQAELEVQRVNKHYQTIIEKSPDGFVLLNEQGNFKYASPSALRMFGYENENLINSSPVLLTHPEDLSMVLEHLNRLLEDTSYIPVIEYRFKHANGEWSWIESTFSNLLADPNVESILINYRDVNDRKLAEIKLQKSEKLFKTMFETSPDAMTLTRITDGVYLNINDGFSNLLGYNRDEIIGFSSFEKNIWFDPAERKHLVDLLQQYGVASNQEYRFLTRDNLIIYALLSAKVIEMDGENHILSIARPINDLKEAQKEIRENIIRLNRAEMASKSGNWEFRLDTNSMFVSEGANYLYGLKKNQYDYDAVKNIPLPEYRPMMDLALKNLVEQNEEYNIEFRIKTADTGELKDIHSTAIYNKQTNTVFGIIQDITEQKVADRKLQANMNLLSKLLFTSTEFIDSESDTIDYKKISDSIFEISGAKYCTFNLRNVNKTSFKTVAISGIETLQKSLKSILGFDLLNKEWKQDPDKDKKINHKIITKFETLIELTGTTLPQKIVKLATKMFDVGEVWVVQVKKRDIIIGDFTLIFSKNETLHNVEIVELYANQIALYIERKQVEIELQESGLKYKILFAENPQPMFIYNLETLKILEVNQTAVDFYGYDKDEFLDMTVIELHPKEEIPGFLKSIEETRKGKNTDGISLHQKKTGEMVYVTISSATAPIFGENARHILIVDMTDRLVAEQKLTESELFFRQSQQAANIGSYHLDMSSGFWSSSDVLDNIFGIDKKYVRSVEGWVDLVAEEDKAMMDDYFVNYVLGQKQPFNKEYRICRKSDGKVFWVLGLGELTIKDNEVTAMIGTIQDITERKNADIELFEKMNQLQRFHNLTVDRELNMIALKKEINNLLVKLGQEVKYRIVE